MSQLATTPSGFRVRASSRSTQDKDKDKQSPKAEVNGNSSITPAKKARPKSDVKKVDDSVSRVRTTSSLVVNKPKSGTGQQLLLPPPRGGVAVVRSANRPVVVEQFAKPRRHRPVVPSSTGSGTGNGRRNEEENNSCIKELQQKLELNEALVDDLESQILALKAELEKAHALNKELESQNQKLSQDLAAAAVTTTCCNQESSIGEYQRPKFKDIQKLIANKLEISKPKVGNESINGPSMVKTSQALRPPPSMHICSSSPAAVSERKALPFPSLSPPPPSLPSASPPPPPPFPSVSPPPPPPLPCLRPLARAASAPATPGIVQFYHTSRKQEEKKDISGPGNQYKPAAMSVHSSIVGEIQNRSAHLLAIKADIETKGDFINGLTEKVLTTSFTDIEDVLTFAVWLDGELSSLADESAVLKHFKWPERKADAIREAAVEYRSLKLLENEISSYKDDYGIPCGSALKKMAVLLDKSERGIQRLGKLRNAVLRCYQNWKIPTDWMLDSEIVSKIKKASVNLAKMYVNRVKMEIELSRGADRDSSQESLLRQGVHFAYRAHQFAGGLDSETLCAFEEIRQCVPGHLLGSRELFAAIPST